MEERKTGSVRWWEWIRKHTEAPAGGAESTEIENSLGVEFDAALKGQQPPWQGDI